MNIYELENVLTQKKREIQKVMNHEWKFYSNYSETSLRKKKLKKSQQVSTVPCCA